MSSPEGSSILFRRPALDVRASALRAYARQLEAALAKGRSFECLITGNAEIRKLNREFRGKDESTDVLSFPAVGSGLLPGRRASARRGARKAGNNDLRGSQRSKLHRAQTLLGSLAISLARARAQARSFGHSTETEVRILMLHGLLHLLGYDHENDSGRMARAEKRWREAFHLPAGLIERVRS